MVYKGHPHPHSIGHLCGFIVFAPPILLCGWSVWQCHRQRKHHHWLITAGEILPPVKDFPLTPHPSHLIHFPKLHCSQLPCSLIFFSLYARNDIHKWGKNGFRVKRVQCQSSSLWSYLQISQDLRQVLPVEQIDYQSIKSGDLVTSDLGWDHWKQWSTWCVSDLVSWGRVLQACFDGVVDQITVICSFQVI